MPQVDSEYSSTHVPSKWTCAPNAYGDGVCNCNCGAWDIDCENVAAETVGCPPHEVCLPPGNVCYPKASAVAQRKLYAQMVYLQTTHAIDFDFRYGRYNVHGPEPNRRVPAEWNCPADYFGSSDGCDCNCGAFDPDCKDETALVLNCPFDPEGAFGDNLAIARCNSQGLCESGAALS